MKILTIIIFILILCLDLFSKDKYLIITSDKYYNSNLLENFIEYRSNDFEVINALNKEIGASILDYQNHISKIKPKYILLVGNYTDFPSKTIPYSKPVESYNYWVSEQKDSLFYMQIPIGLFFVENEKELENIINKTIMFEQNLSEMPDKLYTHSGSIEPLEPWPLEFNDELLEEMYNSFFKQNNYLHRHETSLDETPNDAKSDVQAINNGIKYMLYHGHGNIQKWSFGMGVQGIPYLENTEYYPIIFSASCLTGTFTGEIDTNEAECFATNIIASENGASAFIGAFNISSKGQNPLLHGFCKYVNEQENERLGDALLKAFNNLELPETVNKYYPHVMASEYNRARLQFHLFGDPALKINSTNTDVKLAKNEERVILISPNPVHDYIEISGLINPTVNRRIDGRVSEEITIYNVLGEKVITLSPALSQSERELRIDVSHLPTGMYFIKIGDKVQKFVKE
jgi:hypothetical protein